MKAWGFYGNGGYRSSQLSFGLGIWDLNSVSRPHRIWSLGFGRWMVVGLKGPCVVEVLGGFGLGLGLRSGLRFQGFGLLGSEKFRTWGLPG